MTLQSFSEFRGAGFGRYDVAFGGGWASGGVGVWVDGTGDALMMCSEMRRGAVRESRRSASESWLKWDEIASALA